MNKIILIGRISKDIELRTTQSNKDVANFNIAVNNPHKKDNDGKTLADFFDCIVWGTQAINLQKYQAKGNLIAVEGRLVNQKWQDNNGNNHYKNIVVCESISYLSQKKTATQVTQNATQVVQSVTQNEEDPFLSFGEQIELSDEDLPF